MSVAVSGKLILPFLPADKLKNFPPQVRDKIMTAYSSGATLDDIKNLLNLKK